MKESSVGYSKFVIAATITHNLFFILYCSHNNSKSILHTLLQPQSLKSILHTLLQPQSLKSILNS
jgi:hypothetical protein